MDSYSSYGAGYGQQDQSSSGSYSQASSYGQQPVSYFIVNAKKCIRYIDKMRQIQNHIHSWFLWNVFVTSWCNSASRQLWYLTVASLYLWIKQNFCCGQAQQPQQQQSSGYGQNYGYDQNQYGAQSSVTNGSQSGSSSYGQQSGGGYNQSSSGYGQSQL